MSKTIKLETPVKAYELDPGKVYAIQSERCLTNDEVRALMSDLEAATKRFGVKFILLDRDSRIIQPGA